MTTIGFRFPYSESERNGGEIKKQAGFYVDRAGDMITSPMDIPEGDIRLFVTLVARAIEMHLSEDRTRQQSARPGEPLDMAEYLARRDLPAGLEWRPAEWCTDPGERVAAEVGDGHRVILRVICENRLEEGHHDDRQRPVSTLPACSRNSSPRRPRICCASC